MLGTAQSPEGILHVHKVSVSVICYVLHLTSPEGRRSACGVTGRHVSHLTSYVTGGQPLGVWCHRKTWSWCRSCLAGERI